MSETGLNIATNFARSLNDRESLVADNVLIDKLERENKKMRECLKWYADKSNWQTWCDFGSDKNCKDKLVGSELNEKGYNRAQKCLEELEAGGE